MLSQIDSTYLCQLTATQIQEILVLNGVLIQQYQPHLHRWLTLAQLPDLGQLNLSLEPEKAEEIDLRLHRREIVEFTTMTTVMKLDIYARYVFIPLLEQPDVAGNNQSQLWGRICLSGNLNSVWTAQDLSWVQALGQQLLTAMNVLAGARKPGVTTISSSLLSDLANSIDRIYELETLCQQKDNFINNISHDLRAPLMNIKMAMRMLTTSLETDTHIADLLSGHRSQKYLAILEQECEREVELIDNILDIQRLELSNIPGKSAATDRNNLESIEISTWLTITIEPFIHRANLHSQKIIASAPEWMSIITIDRVGLNKIFTELLNNACKYTQPDGQILVKIDGDPKLEWLTIVVKNQSEIPAQHLPHIFEQFYRIPGSDRSQQGGTGLGLFLVQKLIQQLNGQIHVTSVGGWTEFTVNLPICHSHNN